MRVRDSPAQGTGSFAGSGRVYASEAALDGSVEAVGPIRSEVADAMGGKVAGVGSYELVAQSR